jgi:hypothetical protein
VFVLAWGLFGVNDAVDAAFPRRGSLDAEELWALGESVGRLRERLGYVEAFVVSAVSLVSPHIERSQFTR